jgi:hypothetical protein
MVMCHHELPAHRLDHQWVLIWKLNMWSAGWHIWSRCTLCMVMDGGGCFHTCVDIKPGHVINWPASMVSHHVESDSNNRLA